MNRKGIFPALVSILLLSGIFLIPLSGVNVNIPSTMVASPRIIYVDGNNTGLEDGSELHPYNTIQEGISVATSGDTVKVAGIYTYYESVLIDKALTLTKWEERCPPNPIIDGSESGEGYVVRIESSDVTLSGFTVQGYSEAPHYVIVVYESNRTNIIKNVIKKHDYGIYIQKGRDISILNNTIEDVITGIYGKFYWFGVTGRGIEASRIVNNTIQGSELAAELYGNGVDMPWSSENNFITGNNIANFHYGITTYYNYYTKIADNNISSYYGASDYNSKNITYVNNYIHHSAEGIQNMDCSNNTIENNFFYQNHFAIWLSRVSSTTIRANTILSERWGSQFVSSIDSYNNYLYQNNILHVDDSPPCDEKNSTNHYEYNHWDDYDGVDDDGNGYGDTPYLVAEPDTFDPYPSDVPYGPIPIFWKDERYDCRMLGNTVVSNICFNQPASCIEFNIAVPSFTGWWNLTVPRLLLDGQFGVMIDDDVIPSILSWNKTHLNLLYIQQRGNS
jgi:nitrous oxidase accessory protein